MNLTKRTGVQQLKTLLVSGTVLGSLSVYSTPAFAQIEEILVTARKVDESLQTVPISVTAVTGEALKDLGLTEFPQISAVTPNFDVRSNGVRGAFAADLTMRGQTSTTSDLTIDQAVGININGVPVTRGTNLFSNLFDVEQVEILRGPQGTLFGKNTTGGAVIVTTTEPKLGEFSGYGEVTLGKFNQRDVEAVANLPVGDIAALRVGGAFTKRDGYGQGIGFGSNTGVDFGDDDESFLKASLLIEPNDDLSIRINADTHEVDEHGQINRALRTFSVVAVAIDDSNFYNGADFRTAFVAPRPSEPYVKADETNLNATIEADLGFADLTSVSSYREQESETSLNFSPLGGIILGQDSELLTQELRLSGDNGGLQWQTGVFFSKEEGHDRNNTVNRRQVTAAQNDSAAIFAQGTYALNDRLNLTLGARYTEEERGVDMEQLGAISDRSEVGMGGMVTEGTGSTSIAEWVAAFGSTTLPNGAEIIESTSFTPATLAADMVTVDTPAFTTDFLTTIRNDAEFDAVSWTAALDYQLTDDILGYGSISRGFRSGGIDGDGDLGTIVEPEFVLNYELGLKADFFDNTVRLNSAVWYSDYQDIQIQSFSTTSSISEGVPLAVLNNAAEATLYGFESELEWQPSQDFSLRAGVGYTKGDYQDFTEPRIDPDDATQLIQFDRSGEPVGGPKLQLNVTPRWSFDLSDQLRANAQFTVSHIGKQELAGPEVLAVIEPSQGVIDSITLVNGQVDFDINDSLNVSLWGTNLTDSEYESSGFAIAIFGGAVGLASRYIGAPRQYGVRLNKSF